MRFSTPTSFRFVALVLFGLLVAGPGVVAAGASLSSATDGEDAALDPLAEGLSPRQRLDRLVERVKLEQSKIESMSADFTQHRVSRVLLEPETSTGQFDYRAPDHVRWEYREPKPIVMTIRGDQMTTYFSDLGRAEKASIGGYSEQVFKYLGASGSLETLMKYFALTAEFPEQASEPYRLSLQPRYSRIKKRLRAMEIWLDSETFLPRLLRYVEPSGDETEYRFENLVANAGVSEDLFVVELPAGTQVKKIDLRGR